MRISDWSSDVCSSDLLAHAALAPINAHAFEPGHAFAVANHALGQYRPVALSTFLVARRCAKLERPVGPGQRLVFMFGRARHDFELDHARRTLPVGGAEDRKSTRLHSSH